jgi:hypothetical protein
MWCFFRFYDDECVSPMFTPFPFMRDTAKLRQKIFCDRLAENCMAQKNGGKPVVLPSKEHPHRLRSPEPSVSGQSSLARFGSLKAVSHEEIKAMRSKKRKKGQG